MTENEVVDKIKFELLGRSMLTRGSSPYELRWYDVAAAIAQRLYDEGHSASDISDEELTQICKNVQQQLDALAPQEVLAPMLLQAWPSRLLRDLDGEATIEPDGLHDEGDDLLATLSQRAAARGFDLNAPLQGLTWGEVIAMIAKAVQERRGKDGFRFTDAELIGLLHEVQSEVCNFRGVLDSTLDGAWPERWKAFCSECGESVAPGSGKFVNRVPDATAYFGRAYMGRPYPGGEWVCAECDGKTSDD